LRFIKESVIRATPERVFAFHELPDAFRRLLPTWENSRIVEAASSLEVGTRTIIETKLFGFYAVRWVALHTAYDPPHMFEDVQLEGPFETWRHRHIVKPHEWGAVLRDEIEYETPLSIFGRLGAPFFVRPRLKKLFDYRHQVIRQWAERKG
jgi:ligand-binding SRPBCC domain-containing protein